MMAVTGSGTDPRVSSGCATVIIEKAAEPLTSPNTADMFFHRGCALNQLVLKALVVALAVIQVDNPTPIILSGEKSVIRGTHGSVVQSPYTRSLSNVGSPCVGAVSSRSGIAEPWRYPHGWLSVESTQISASTVFARVDR
jgi:hypothetical protein